jgi:hypothetical protein
MTVMAAVVIRELGMMHLVTGSETYKTTSGVITQALGRIEKVPVKVGGVLCTMTFMVVDIDNYDVLLGLDFLMKIGAIVDVERGLIQVRHGPSANVEAFNNGQSAAESRLGEYGARVYVFLAELIHW